MLRILSVVDLPGLETPHQQQITQLKNLLFDTRLDIQDYELAETRDHQLANASDARRRLVKVHGLIANDNSGVFGAVDTAYLTAKVSQINDRLR